MTDRETKRAAIMTMARGFQKILADEMIAIDTIIIGKDKVTLSHGSPNEDDYREIEEIYIDDKTIEDFEKSFDDIDKEDTPKEKESKPKSRVHIMSGRIYW